MIGEGGSITSASVVNDTGELYVHGIAAAATVNPGGTLWVATKGATGDVAVKGGWAYIDGHSGSISVNTDGRLSVAQTGATGDVAVTHGWAFINGQSGNTLVDIGGVLTGSGTIASLDAKGGGTVAPGNSVGALHVVGDATFDTGSAFNVEIATDKMSADQLAIGGTATLQGGTVTVSMAGDKSTLTEGQIAELFQRHYDILTASMVGGSFEGVLPQYNYIVAGLNYSDKSKVSLGFDLADVPKPTAIAAVADPDSEPGLTRAFNDITLVDAKTKNQISVGNAVKQLGLGNGLANTVLFSQVGQKLNYDSVSGEIHASLKGALADDSRFVRDAAANRIRDAFGDSTGGKGSAPTTGPANVNAQPAAFWGEGYGSWSHREGDGNAAGLSRNIGGFLTGLDGEVADTWRVGLLAGYGNTSLSIPGSSASVDSYQLGIYGGTRVDPLILSLGAGFAHHDIDVKRTASFGSIVDSDKVSYGGNSTQVFGEAAYLIDTPYASFEPFAGAAYVHLNTGSFGEDGGISALSGHDDGTDLATTTLGLRASHDFLLGEATTVTAHGTAGWRHAFGDTTPTASLAFAGGSAFSIDGLPIAEDAGLVEAGFDVALSKRASLDISYSGQFSSQAHDNAVKADLRVRF